MHSLEKVWTNMMELIKKKIMIKGKKDMTSGRCYEVCLAKEHYYQIKIAVAIVVLSLQKKKKKKLVP